jgi:hypothetical protein
MQSISAIVAIAVIGVACSGEAQTLTPAPASAPAGFTAPTDMERTSTYNFTSQALEQTRPVFVGLPRSFGKTHRTYPVLIVMD